MSLHALRTGHQVKIGAAVFLIVQRLPEDKWQLQNTMTGEWRTMLQNTIQVPSRSGSRIERENVVAKKALSRARGVCCVSAMDFFSWRSRSLASLS